MTDPLKRSRILIVDDKRTNIDILKTILADYDKMIALNGEQALKVAFSHTPPDLILLDIMMPDMDGYEVRRRLQADERTRGIPVIFVTAKREVEDETKGLQLGAVDYITKPFNPDIIKSRINNHLELKRHRTRLEEMVAERTKQLESALKRAEAAMEAAEAGNRAKNEFLAIISHELRTPLNHILGFAPILGDSSLGDEERREFSQMVDTAGKVLLNLINEMLELAKVEAGEVRLRKRLFLLSDSITGALNTVQNDALTKNLQLTSYVAPGVPEKVMGDDQRLRQVLLHLLRNGIAFTNAGSVAVEVAPDPESSDGGLRFSVRDTGVGIPADKCDLIFQFFTQLEPSLTRRHDGLGLGLTVCSRFVSLMGGKIWVESEEGKGSTFHFTLPFESA